MSGCFLYTILFENKKAKEHLLLKMHVLRAQADLMFHPTCSNCSNLFPLII